MTLEGIKERLRLFCQFDQTMEKLMKELDDFKKNSKTLIKEKHESIKLYGHAFNLAWTLYNSIDVCQKYEAEIKGSLFYGRFEKNKEYADRLEDDAHELISFIENVMQSFCLEDEGEGLTPLTHDLDKERLLSDSKYLAKLKRHLGKNGNRILNIVCFYLRCIEQVLTNIKNFRANLTENDYRFLFEREFKDYLSTDEWDDMRNTFIEKIITRKYHGQEPTREQLIELLNEEAEKIEDMSDNFGAIEPYLDDYTKLARIIIQREFKTEINTPIMDLFHHLGRKQIIEKWQEQLEEEELCYIPEEDEMEVTYNERFSEKVCKRAMPIIMELFEDRNAMDWVCFYHVLVCYNYISCDDFNAFNRWLTQVAGKELISTANARKTKMSYWAQQAKIKWSKEGALAHNNTPQQETKFRDYTQLCDKIRDVINEAKK